MNERVFPEERMDQIQDLLQVRGRVSVNELVDRFGVSAVTIRSDLTTLEHQGRLIRTHGGAMSKPDTGLEPAFALRLRICMAETERIGRAAAGSVAGRRKRDRCSSWSRSAPRSFAQNSCSSFHKVSTLRTVNSDLATYHFGP